MSSVCRVRCHHSNYYFVYIFLLNFSAFLFSFLFLSQTTCEPSVLHTTRPLRIITPIKSYVTAIFFPTMNYCLPDLLLDIFRLDLLAQLCFFYNLNLFAAILAPQVTADTDLFSPYFQVFFCIESPIPSFLTSLGFLLLVLKV